MPLSFAPGEAYQFDRSHEVVLINGATVTVKVAHRRHGQDAPGHRDRPSLHPHVIGVAHRMDSFWGVMEELAAHPQVAFATSSEIGDWYTALHPAP